MGVVRNWQCGNRKIEKESNISRSQMFFKIVTAKFWKIHRKTPVQEYHF